MVHRAIVVIGAAAVVLGLVLTLVPLVGGPSIVLTPAHPYAAFNATTPFSITGSWTIGVDWSANEPVSLLVVLCRAINVSATSLATVCPGSSLTVLNGSSGSPSFGVPLGGALLVGIVSTTNSGLRVSVQLKLTETVLGAILVVGGVGVIVVGVVPVRRARPKSPPGPPSPPEQPPP